MIGMKYVMGRFLMCACLPRSESTLASVQPLVRPISFNIGNQEPKKYRVMCRYRPPITLDAAKAALPAALWCIITRGWTPKRTGKRNEQASGEQ